MNHSATLAALKALPPSVLVTIFVMPVFFIGVFFVFIVRCAIWGMPRTPRMDKLAATKLVPRFILEWGYWWLQIPVRGLVACGVGPDAVTFGSLAFACAASASFALGHFGAGGWLLFASMASDALDGMVARATGVSSDRGEFIDAVVDRYADCVIYLGLMYFYRHAPVPLALAAAALIGSSVMGYARAKGEAMGIDPNVGWMARHERGIVLGLGTTLAPLASLWLEPGVTQPRYYTTWVALGLIGFFTNITSIWRTGFVLARMKKK